jgi:pilus assembly protein CpaF
MALMAGIELPLIAIREQIRRGIQIIVHQERAFDGRRRITHVVEIVGGGAEGYELREIAA